jgi:hypothetical protein
LQGGADIVEYYGGSRFKALSAIYPELTLKQDKFFPFKGLVYPFILRHRFLFCVYSIDKEKRRQFLDEFAKSMNFNPLEIENWNVIARKAIISAVCTTFQLVHK